MERRPRIENMKVMFANVQSMINKIDEIKAVVQMQKPDIFALTETWSNDDIGNDLLRVEGYEIINRLDRNDTERGRGGGIIIYAKKEIDIMTEETNTNFNQCSTVKIKSRGEDVRLHVIYRSPNSARSNDDDLCEWVRNMREAKFPDAKIK